MSCVSALEGVFSLGVCTGKTVLCCEVAGLWMDTAEGIDWEAVEGVMCNGSDLWLRPT